MTKLIIFEELKSQKGISYCRQHLRRMCRAREFPQPIPLSNRRIAWLEEEVDAWVEGRKAQRSSNDGLLSSTPASARICPGAEPNEQRTDRTSTQNSAASTAVKNDRPTDRKTQRNAEIYNRRSQGEKYTSIGLAFNISIERVRQIVMREKRRIKQSNHLKVASSENDRRSERIKNAPVNATYIVHNHALFAYVRHLARLLGRTDLKIRLGDAGDIQFKGVDRVVVDHGGAP